MKESMLFYFYSTIGIEGDIMKLTLLALSYFQKTAELQHLTRAAEALHISQPSLSHTIKVLETELGVPLFSRSGRNIVLTKYGEILLRHTNRIMQELHGAQKELADTKEAQKLTVTISLFAASMIIPSFLTRFRQEHPDIRFEISRGSRARTMWICSCPLPSTPSRTTTPSPC